MSAIVQSLSLCTADSVFYSGQKKDRQEEAVDSRKRSGEYMDSPKGKRPRRQSADVAVSYAFPSRSIATHPILILLQPSVRTAIKPAFSQNTAKTSASHAPYTQFG
jgi:hypothetical protein